MNQKRFHFTVIHAAPAGLNYTKQKESCCQNQLSSQIHIYVPVAFHYPRLLQLSKTTTTFVCDENIFPVSIESISTASLLLLTRTISQRHLIFLLYPNIGRFFRRMSVGKKRTTYRAVPGFRSGILPTPADWPLQWSLLKTTSSANCLLTLARLLVFPLDRTPFSSGYPQPELGDSVFSGEFLLTLAPNEQHYTSYSAICKGLKSPNIICREGLKQEGLRIKIEDKKGISRTISSVHLVHSDSLGFT